MPTPHATGQHPVPYTIHPQSAMRGRKASADKIEIKGVDDKSLWEAARRMDGFSGG